MEAEGDCLRLKKEERLRRVLESRISELDEKIQDYMRIEMAYLGQDHSLRNPSRSETQARSERYAYQRVLDFMEAA